MEYTAPYFFKNGPIDITTDEIINLYDQQEYDIILSHISKNTSCLNLTDVQNYVMLYAITTSNIKLINALCNMHIDDFSDYVFLYLALDPHKEEILRMISENIYIVIKIRTIIKQILPHYLIGFAEKILDHDTFLKILMTSILEIDDTFTQIIITCAIYRNKSDTIEYLFELGYDIQTTFDNLLDDKNDLSSNKNYYFNEYHPDLRTIFSLIRCGVDIIRHINELFIMAVMDKNLEFVKFCVEHGADINYDNGEPIWISCTRSLNVDIAKFLLQNGSTIDHINSDTIETGMICLSLGNHININTNIFEFIELINLLIENGFCINDKIDRLLIHSAGCGLPDLVTYFINLGADVNASDNSALFLAASRGNIKTVGLLLEFGADIHALHDGILLFCLDRTNLHTVMHDKLINSSESNSSFEMFCLLIDNDAVLFDPSILISKLSNRSTDDDVVPNSSAIISKLSSRIIDDRIIEYFIENTDINISELFLACVYSNKSNIMTLILQQKEEQINKNAMLQMAIMWGNLAGVKILLDYGAQLDMPKYSTSAKIIELIESYGINNHNLCKKESPEKYRLINYQKKN